MTVYHFTNRRFIEGIKKEGLTKGRTPFDNGGKLDFLDDHQWVTTDMKVDNQKWAKAIMIPYNRNEYRIEINIPNNQEMGLHSMDEVMEFLGDMALEGFNDFPDETKEWKVFIGKIPPQWIKSIRRVA